MTESAKDEALRLAKEVGLAVNDRGQVYAPVGGAVHWEDLIALIAAARQGNRCPHIRSTDEGTHYCALVRGNVASAAEVEMKLSIFSRVAGCGRAFMDHGLRRLPPVERLAAVWLAAAAAAIWLVVLFPVLLVIALGYGLACWVWMLACGAAKVYLEAKATERARLAGAQVEERTYN